MRLLVVVGPFQQYYRHCTKLFIISFLSCIRLPIMYQDGRVNMKSSVQ